MPGIRFDPNALTYDPTSLRKIIDRPFAKKVDASMTIPEGRAKILETEILDADAYRLSGISAKSLARLAAAGFGTVRSVIQTADADAFKSLPPSLRKACEHARTMAQQAIIYY
jgi:hypothetical protein